MDVTTQEWTDIDVWWESTAESDPSPLFDGASAVVDPGWLDEQESTLDWWWDSTIQSRQSVLIDGLAGIDANWVTELWSELDPWWETYLAARNKDITELLTELDAADKVWAASLSRFNVDPLSVDWRTTGGSTGPIRLSREEDWSHGLAHFLRSEDSELVTELFEEGSIGQTMSVDTEVHLPGGDDTTRYEDILVTGSNGGISIEVKIGDTNLQKTLDTTALVERHYYGDWTHVLLVPEYQLPELRAAFGDDLSEDNSDLPVIKADRSADIQVRYWREISATLRKLLRTGELSPHWEASAYVFCTLIEQRILGLVPRPVVERMSEAADVVHSNESLSVRIGDIESEIEYLRDTTGKGHNN
jgi:hypothetical protein